MPSPTIADHVEQWPLDKLIPYTQNARTHSDNQVDQIADSILEFGFTNPILADGGGTIIAGHARVLAARKLGLPAVSVIVLNHLTEIQKRAYRLADNQLPLNAGWNLEMLERELVALEQESFKIELTGISDQEFDDLRAKLERELESADEDVVPETPATPVTLPGDLIILGDHRLLCGDATAKQSVATVMAGGQADLVFTDPPYNVALGRSGRQNGREARPITNDDLGPEFGKFLHAACVNVLGVANGAVYICMSSSQLPILQMAFTEAGGHWSTFLIWAKNTFTLGRSDYQRQYEPILYGWRQGGRHYWCGARDQGDVWFLNKPHVNDLHPTMKPVELVERAIRNSSRIRDVVLDPFAGAGSTLIACERTKRQARLIEIEPKYVDVIIERWQKFTGRQAILAADGRPFAEVARDRRAQETSIGDRVCPNEGGE